MANPARFLFDRDLAATATAEPAKEEVVYVEPTILKSEHDRLVREAEKRGFERGQAEERTKVGEEGMHVLAKEAAKLANSAAELLLRLDGELDRIEKDSVGFAFLIARRFAGHLIAREPLGEVVALISECLGPLRRAPHVVIRVCERDSETLRAHVDKIAFERGFEGRIVILGEPEIERGDCRLEWADGGLVRDRKTLEKHIEAAIRRYFAARRPAADTTGA
ncbi:flagellar assembly protein FliH [Breoghania corrubedonensis]|uniref:Flagellar assembly protein FliH n=1 Tax=Breoghania corrubedonensis TaxID=665038 RepID=A0A2T5UU22_9HYPH|nr:FliH/SctL family protein [Breoghania corrubedonensis]PTW54994.1 flagellar assembly protein FliH [Breoghania corrubedonensis]